MHVTVHTFTVITVEAELPLFYQSILDTRGRIDYTLVNINCECADLLNSCHKFRKIRCAEAVRERTEEEQYEMPIL